MRSPSRRDTWRGLPGQSPSSLGSIAIPIKGFIMWLGQSARALLSAFLLFYLWSLKFDRSGASQPEGARPVEPAC